MTRTELYNSQVLSLKADLQSIVWRIDTLCAEFPPGMPASAQSMNNDNLLQAAKEHTLAACSSIGAVDIRPVGQGFF